MKSSKEIKILQGVIQGYDWGRGPESIIHQGFGYCSENQKYAELWYGAHPKAPAIIKNSKENLFDYCQKRPEVLGTNSQFPFLFKVLSVNQALSIQAHPDAALAPSLHSLDPKNYPDRFPKPEVGIAISTVTLLYGFRSISELAEFLTPTHLNYCPELQALLSSTRSLNYREIYQTLIEHPASELKKLSDQLADRLNKKTVPSKLEQEILKAISLYPEGDPGIFCFYLLNFVEVAPGQALFIDSNIPHAYLHGELLECMAPSDNVVRGGLTSKYIDQQTLLSMLIYQHTPPDILQTVENDSLPLSYYPVPNNNFFEIAKIKSSSLFSMVKDSVVQLIFCLSGELLIQSAETKQELLIPAGEAAFIPASMQKYQVNSQNAVAFLVSSKNLSF